ncbi:MAG TPA: hypothetical protein VFT16_03960 [Candidatus Saccharimonadales bacterium]|nr:hypothetical protein [Candidatus Saccharimonadales bacterium]
MMRKRLVSPAFIKFAVIVLAIKELWLLLGIPAFSDALISFLTVGAIPGTNRTLSPDEMYRLLFCVLVLFVLLVFRKEIVRFIRGRRKGRVTEGNLSAAAAAMPEAPVMPLAHPLAAIAIHPPVEIKQPSLPAGIQPQPSRRELLRARWRLRLAATRMLLAVGGAAAWARARIVIARGASLTVAGGNVLLRACVLATGFVVTAAIVTWHMAEPYARKFDAWLERKFHEYELTRTLLSIGSEMVGTTRKWGASAKAAYDEARIAAKGQREQ